MIYTIIVIIPNIKPIWPKRKSFFVIPPNTIAAMDATKDKPNITKPAAPETAKAGIISRMEATPKIRAIVAMISLFLSK
jgi:hypothetical protein